MIVVMHTSPKPCLALHCAGEQVECRALSDRELVELVCAASAIAVATRPGTPIPKAASQLIDLLHAYQSGSRRPSYRVEEDEKFDPALRRAATALEPSGHHVVLAGMGHRNGPAGVAEDVAFILLSDQSLSNCVVQVDLDEASRAQL